MEMISNWNLLSFLSRLISFPFTYQELRFLYFQDDDDGKLALVIIDDMAHHPDGD